MKRTLNTVINGVTLEEVLHYKEWPRVAMYKATDEQLKEAAQELVEYNKEVAAQEYLDHWDYLMGSIYD